MVEFAAVILPLLFIVVGIIQFGLILGANVSITNAAREGAREATIYRYLTTETHSANGVNRCTAALDAATQAFGFLSTSAPSFTAASPCPAGADLTGDGKHDRWSNGDLVVSVCAAGTDPGVACPNAADSATFCTFDSGEGCLVRVRLTYDQPIIVPLLDAVLDGDGDGLFHVTAESSMVIN
jgi:hypothetical protein